MFRISVLVVLICSMVTTESKYIGGYYASSALRTLDVSDINPFLLTHIYYAFVTVYSNGTLSIQNEAKGFVEPLAELKSINPDLKVLFTLVQTNKSLSDVVSNKDLRTTLIQNGYDLVKKYNYDGIDIDWEYPSSKDKDNFMVFLQELSEEFHKHNYLVTAAVCAIPTAKYGYNVSEMAKYLDVINIMTYDFYGAWSAHTGLNSGLYASSLDSGYEKKYLNVNTSVNNWVSSGTPKNILAFGVPFYGRTFNLTDPSSHGIHSKSKGAGKIKTPTFYQIEKYFADYTDVWDDEQKGYYKYLNSTWLSYDEQKSVALKTKYACDQGLKGLFVWHLGADDVKGEISGVNQTLLQTINDSWC
ncbi:acidic mammalian chitinase-like [Sitophilus oryzae]|uniref:Acidic mammalian chitinase-like n=1 Tax=Sitophilus oryzae TaxID=7048 RepID=A0A6J2XQR9_SITOR|nr:acidic mammalian chitinase-like [Sitophilus oryzae]